MIFYSNIFLFHSYIVKLNIFIISPPVRLMVHLELYFWKFVQFSPFIHVCLLFSCSGFSKFSSKQLVHELEWFDNSVLSSSIRIQNAKWNSYECFDGKHKLINCQRTKVEFFNNLALKRKYRKSLKIRSKATCLDCRGSLGNLNKAVFAA